MRFSLLGATSEIIVYCGLVTAALSFLYACYIVLRGLFGHFSTMGYASTLTAISFFGGATIATLGVVGLCVGRILRQVKGRPTYISRKNRFTHLLRIAPLDSHSGGVPIFHDGISTLINIL